MIKQGTSIVSVYSFSTYVGVFVSLLAAGCTQYQPHLLDPPALEQIQRKRDLNDPELRSFVEQRSSKKITEWPPTTVTQEMLTLIGWHFSPDLEVSRAAVRTAEANVLAAGGRVNPSLSVSSGYNTAPESAALFDFLPSFTIETAGKRGKRVLLAEAQLAVAQLRVAEAAWRVRSDIHSAYADWVAASQGRAMLAEQVDVRSEALDMFRLRLQVGETARPIVDAAAQELDAAKAALADANGRQSSARAALAATLGLSVDALSNVRVIEPGADSWPSVDRLPLPQVQRAGLLHRSDVRRSLAEYAAAEAEVRLETAQQYPNVQLGPGVVFEEGFIRYVFAFALAPPLLNRNQGPIAVAEARRAESEARFKQLQASALAEMARALARYDGAREELAVADERVAAAFRVQEASRSSLSAGETDRLTLAGERLLRIAAEQGRVDALARTEQAFNALEDSVQQPLAGDLRSFERQTTLPEAQSP